MFYNYLKQGGYIKIENDGKHNKYDLASRFWMENDKIMASNSALGTFEHETFNNNPALFNEHIKRMMDEKYRVILQAIKF